MKVDNEIIPKDKQSLVIYIFIAVVLGFVFFGLFNATVNVLMFLITFIIKYWFYGVLLIIGLLVIRKLISKKRK